VTLADLHAAARTLARETLTDLDRQGVDKLGADWWCGRLSFALEALCNSLDELDASEELAGDTVWLCACCLHKNKVTS
jgi:hypothetical protein